MIASSLCKCQDASMCGGDTCTDSVEYVDKTNV